MRGGSTCETKQSEISSVMFERKLRMNALSETKVTGKSEGNLGIVVGRVPGVGHGRAKKGVAMLLSKPVLEGVVKVKFQEEIWVFVCDYGPGREGSD